ncbi:MAG: inorganic pyrophosphatase [Myxococcales bacterium]|nr:inorganic pyrophosphatase [Myxococcales bacterium]
MAFPKPFYRWRPHPWHGLEVGPKPPYLVHAFIEITPFDLVKYEVDKITGYLYLDRPQRSSSQHPALYGFIPRTYCGARVRDLSPKAKDGDGDPLDVCVISERPVTRGEVVVTAKVIGGLQMVDHSEADDKIIAVVDGDHVWGAIDDISDLPPVLVERLQHYFLTYKMIPGHESNVSIESVYSAEHARAVINASIEDYRDEYE